jgi:hypothetical protein
LPTIWRWPLFGDRPPFGDRPLFACFCRALSEHTIFRGAAGISSDSDLVQAHPQLPGKNGEPRPRKSEQSAVGNHDGVSSSNSVSEASTSHGASQSGSAPAERAPPGDYISRNAQPVERHRFRGVRKVDTHLTSESHANEPGGVLTQARTHAQYHFAHLLPLPTRTALFAHPR